MGLLTNSDTYSRYYGDFRGVDFSSDHTQVHEQRLAYAVNMYKDYQSGQGHGLETIPGFRRRVNLPESSEVYGIHSFKFRNEFGEIITRVLIHAGANLYIWGNYPLSSNVEHVQQLGLPEDYSEALGVKTFTMDLSSLHVFDIKEVHLCDGSAVYKELWSYNSGEFTLSGSALMPGEIVTIIYTEGGDLSPIDVNIEMNTTKSTSFVFNNRMYIIDGKNYLVYDGEKIYSVLKSAYIPTTHINIVPSGENADAGRQKENRNMLCSEFKHTFIADGETTDFYMNENQLEGVAEVKVYGETLTEGTDYTVDLIKGAVKFTKAPKKPEEVVQAQAEGGESLCYPELYAGVEITASKAWMDDGGANIEDGITRCTVATVFDNRVFLSGNPSHPNRIFWSALNDATYFPVINWDDEGVGDSPVTGMLAVAGTLMVLKADTRQDGSVYFHTPMETGDDLNPKSYPSTPGLNGTGCLGACVNFLDDPVFVSRLGLEAMGQLSVRLERAIEHRSSLVDARLVNLDLLGAVLEEWNGYLCLLVDGKIFMADSRERYTHDTGVMQYEWYYLEDIGVYEQQYPEYRYAADLHELAGVKVQYCTRCGNSASACECENTAGVIELELKIADDVYHPEYMESRSLVGEVVNKPVADEGKRVQVFSQMVSVTIDGSERDAQVHYTVREFKDEDTGELISREAFLCEKPGNFIGGEFKPAVCLKTIDNNLFFGTSSGAICSFNFDLRGEDGDIPSSAYSFDGRTILCGCATKMDNCGIPHMTKNTLKKSTVVKTKTLPSAAAKIKVRTNRKPYEQIARISSKTFSFDDMDFSDFSFVTSEQSLFAVKEKEKKWVEKQHFIYSDEYLKPFALYYIAFRYTIAGRYKQQ